MLSRKQQTIAGGCVIVAVSIFYSLTGCKDSNLPRRADIPDVGTARSLQGESGCGNCGQRGADGTCQQGLCWGKETCIANDAKTQWNCEGEPLFGEIKTIEQVMLVLSC